MNRMNSIIIVSSALIGNIPSIEKISMNSVDHIKAKLVNVY